MESTEANTIAYFDASHDLPEEIVMAAGMTPYKILGDVNTPNDLADQYLAQFFCPQARSFLTEALQSPNKWAGIIIAHGCDATNRQFDVWKMHVETPFLYWFNAPMKYDKSAQKFFKVELNRLIKVLESQYGVSITTEKLQEAIQASNEIKSLMRECAALRAEKDIPNADYFEMLKFCFINAKVDVKNKLQEILADWQARDPFPADKKRILLTGSDVTYVEWMQILDDSGLRVVRDDLSIGERYFAISIPDLADPLDAIIQYHINKPRAATKHPTDPRLDFLIKALGETKVDGILSQNMKFCEPYAIDSVYINEGLKKKGFKLIHLERDFTASMDEQLRNRLEAFKETI
jgi:benzoyl-CoA reductase/2-hydroxyglutaryl-CoA dehydratase subunit BcrC/BadD/HgdB